MFDFDGNARAIEAMSDTERDKLLSNTINSINFTKKSLASVFTAPAHLDRAEVDKDLFLLFKSFFGKNISDGAIISLLGEFNMFMELDNAVYHSMGRLSVTTTVDDNGKPVKKLYSGDTVLATSTDLENSIFIFNKEKKTNYQVHVGEGNFIIRSSNCEDLTLIYDEDNLLKSRRLQQFIKEKDFFGTTIPACTITSEVERSDCDPMHVSVSYEVAYDDKKIASRLFAGYVDPIMCFSLNDFKELSDDYNPDDVIRFINKQDNSLAMFPGRIFPRSRDALMARISKNSDNKTFLKTNE